jgi:cytochrome c biogenesis protein ResB
MDKIKKIIFFIVVMAIFSIPGFLFSQNTEFYDEINLHELAIIDTKQLM